jgi:hypothetical protein
MSCGSGRASRCARVILAGWAGLCVCALHAVAPACVQVLYPSLEQALTVDGVFVAVLIKALEGGVDVACQVRCAHYEATVLFCAFYAWYPWYFLCVTCGQLPTSLVASLLRHATGDIGCIRGYTCLRALRLLLQHVVAEPEPALSHVPSVAAIASDTIDRGAVRPVATSHSTIGGVTSAGFDSGEVVQGLLTLLSLVHVDAVAVSSPSRVASARAFSTSMRALPLSIMETGAGSSSPAAAAVLPRQGSSASEGSAGADRVGGSSSGAGASADAPTAAAAGVGEGVGGGTAVGDGNHDMNDAADTSELAVTPNAVHALVDTRARSVAERVPVIPLAADAVVPSHDAMEAWRFMWRQELVLALRLSLSLPQCAAGFGRFLGFDQLLAMARVPPHHLQEPLCVDAFEQETARVMGEAGLSAWLASFAADSDDGIRESARASLLPRAVLARAAVDACDAALRSCVANLERVSNERLLQLMVLPLLQVRCRWCGL